MARLNISMNSPQGEDTPVVAPPAGDIDVKLLKIQDEMDLLKTSIKKLLIDIRDRLNEKDNPFLRPGPFPGKANVEAEDPPAMEEEKKEEEAEEPLPEEEKIPEPEESFPAAEKTVQEELANMLRGKGKMPPVPAFHPEDGGEAPAQEGPPALRLDLEDHQPLRA